MDYTKKRKPSRPERAYYAFIAFQAFCWGATATGYPVFQRFIGLSNTQIFLVEVVFNLVLFSCELPTGMLADGKGRAFSIGWGAALVAIGACLIGIAHGFWSVLPGFIILGIAEALMSGALQAWTMDALAAKGRKQEFGRVVSHGGVIGGIVMWFGGLAGAFSLSYTPRIQWLISSLCAAFMTYIVVIHMAGRGNPAHRERETEALRRSWSALRASSALRWAVLAGMVFPFFWVAHLQWQPKAYDAFNLHPLFFGWTAVCVGAALGGYINRHVTDQSSGMLAGLGVMGLSLIALSFVDAAGLPVCMFTLWLGRGWFDPAANTFVQERVASEYRATFGSLQSFLSRVVTMAIFVVMSWRSYGLSYEHAVNTVFLLSGVLMLFGVALLAFLFRWTGARSLRVDFDVAPTSSSGADR